MAKDKEKSASDDKAAKKVQPKTKKKTTDKWKKKSWYAIVAPSEFENKVMGETLAEKPESLEGRKMIISGRDLANQPKKQHVQLRFRVTSIRGNSAITEAVGHEIKDSYLRRVVRRRSSKVMSVRNYVTKNGVVFKVKIVVVTDRKASQRQRTSIKKKTEEIAEKMLSELDSKKVVDELVFGTVPSKMYPELKKIVPIKRIEITKSAIVATKG